MLRSIEQGRRGVWWRRSRLVKEVEGLYERVHRFARGRALAYLKGLVGASKRKSS